VQRFRGGLVIKAHRLCVALNSRRESNQEERRIAPPGRGPPSSPRQSRWLRAPRRACRGRNQHLLLTRGAWFSSCCCEGVFGAEYTCGVYVGRRMYLRERGRGRERGRESPSLSMASRTQPGMSGSKSSVEDKSLTLLLLMRGYQHARINRGYLISYLVYSGILWYNPRINSGVI